MNLYLINFFSPRSARSRADIEAQRQLHRELLDESGTSSDDKQGPQSSDDSMDDSDSDSDSQLSDKGLSLTNRVE